MGIQGLLPFLKKACTPYNVKEFNGCCVAIDTYCWLHKGAFACADKLAKGEKTDQYVFYCLKYVNALLSYGVTPILVFDGCHLPSKKEVEKARRERREINRKKGKEFLREGRLSEARDCFQKCVDVTSAMALEVIEACRAIGVDCIVAPYEADSQLAYLCKNGIVQLVITEDSDLVLFGCDKILFKMDLAGNGILYDKAKLSACFSTAANKFTFDKFRHMCIMSGCDYHPSLPGIGLGKALKFFSKTNSNDLKHVLKKIPVYLNMPCLDISSEYIEGFIQADNTFLYQLVFDPFQRRLVPLNPYPPEADPKNMNYAGPLISNEIAFGIALGNINVNTLERRRHFDPDTFKWANKHNSRLSIWSPNYKSQTHIKPEHNFKKETFTAPTLGKKIKIDTNKILSKRNIPEKNNSVEDNLDIESLTAFYLSSKENTTNSHSNPSVDRAVSSEKTKLKENSSPVYSRFFGKPLSINSEEKMSEKVSCLKELEKEDHFLTTDRKNAVCSTSIFDTNSSLYAEQKCSMSSSEKKASKSVFDWNTFEYRFPKLPKVDHLSVSPNMHTEFKPVVEKTSVESVTVGSSQDSGLDNSYFSDHDSPKSQNLLSNSSLELCSSGYRSLNSSFENDCNDIDIKLTETVVSPDVVEPTEERGRINEVISRKSFPSRTTSTPRSGILKPCRSIGLKKKKSSNSKKNSSIQGSLLKFAFVKNIPVLETSASLQLQT